MRVQLDKNDCYCSLEKFYENVSKKMGVDATDNILFDCTKVCVSKAVQDEIWAFYYEEEGYSNMQISAMLLAMGPKANIVGKKLGEYVAEVEDGYLAKPTGGAMHG